MTSVKKATAAAAVETFQSYAVKEILRDEKEFNALHKMRELISTNNQIHPFHLIRESYLSETELAFYNECLQKSPLTKTEKDEFIAMDRELERFYNKFVRTVYGRPKIEIEDEELTKAMKDCYTKPPKNEKKETRQANRQRDKEIERRKEYERQVQEAEKERAKQLQKRKKSNQSHGKKQV